VFNIGPLELLVLLVTPAGSLLAAGYLALALRRNHQRRHS
jgi:hypothetical protein